MRFMAPMAFLGTGGMRASTLPTPLVIPVESNLIESSLRSIPDANTPKSSVDVVDSPTLPSRRKWIQSTALPFSTILFLSSSAKAALANDNSVDPNHSQSIRSDAFLSPLRQWLNSNWTMKNEDGSSQYDSEESSNGNDDSSSSIGGSSISSDE